MRPDFDKSPGTADLFSYGFLVSDGVVVCTDGSLIGGWIVSAPDDAAWAESAKVGRSEQINAAFRIFGGGWSFWYDIVSLRHAEYCDSSADAFPDPVTRRIDVERRDAFGDGGLFVTERKQVLLAQYTPVNKRARRASTFLFDEGDDAKDRRSEAAIAEQELATVRAKIAAFENAMSGAAKLSRLSDYVDPEDGLLCSDLVNYIDFRISGVSREVAITHDGLYLAGVFAYDDFDTEYPIKFGNDFILCLTIDGFPRRIGPGVLDALARLDAEYVWSTRFVMRETQAALKEIATTSKNWNIKVHGVIKTALDQKSGRINKDAKDMAEDADDAEHKAHSEGVGYGFLTSVLVFRGPDFDHLKACADEAKKIIRRAKFNARLEDWNSVDAWIGTLVGHPLHNVRRPMLNTMNFADMMCWSSVWRGPDVHPNPYYQPGSNPLMYAVTKGATPFRVNFFDSDRGSVLGFGPIGSGKTAMLNAIAAQQMRYPGMWLWALDFKYGLYTMARECGWHHYDLASGDGPSFCPLGMVDDDDEAAFGKMWLEERFHARIGKAPDETECRAIHDAVELMRQLSTRSLSDFCALVRNERVRDAIEHYTIAGAAGKLLDGESDALGRRENAVFEMEEFVQSYSPAVAGAVYAYLFRRFLRGLRRDMPSVMLVDEGHYAFRDKFWAGSLDTMGRTIRSKNGSLIIFTQSIQEAIDNNIGVLLRESCPTKIFLPNACAADDGSGKYLGPKDYYHAIGCTDDDIEVIRTARAKQHYYLCQPAGKQLIDLCLAGTLMRIIETPVIRQTRVEMEDAA